MRYRTSIVEVYPERAWLKGAFAGLIATGPMTIFMLLTQRFLPKEQRYALAPEMITKEIARRVHVKPQMSHLQIVGATLVSHFGYGAGMGALYGLMEKKLPLPALTKGVLFSLVVWAGSYLGLLPLLGISASAQREPLRRNLLMMAAHIVWGTVMSMIVAVFLHQSKPTQRVSRL